MSPGRLHISPNIHKPAPFGAVRAVSYINGKTSLVINDLCMFGFGKDTILQAVLEHGLKAV